MICTVVNPSIVRIIPVNSIKEPAGADGKQNASVIVNIPVLHKKHKANRLNA